jgi:hypothetical protein
MTNRHAKPGASSHGHITLEVSGEPVPLPGLHIAEIVAQHAKADGRACVGLLGINGR